MERYWQAKATHGACLTAAERGDSWLAMLFAVIEKVYTEHERYTKRKDLVDLLKVMR